MMRVTLYRAELLNSEKNNIIPSLENYLATQPSYVVNMRRDFELYDDITVQFDSTDIVIGFFASYAKCEDLDGGNVAYYYITKTERVTPKTVLMTMERDYVNETVGKDNIGDINVFGQYVAGHFPLTYNAEHPAQIGKPIDNISYELPLPVGDATNLVRNAPLKTFVWGDDGESALVIRVILSSDYYLTNSKVMLLRTPYYQNSYFKDNLPAINSCINDARKFVSNGGGGATPIEHAYGIVEITDAWIIPYGYAPDVVKGTSSNAIVADNGNILAGGEDSVFDILPATSVVLDAHTFAIVPKTNARIYVGNAVANIEIPHTVSLVICTVLSSWNADKRIKITLRVGDKYVDISQTFSIATNTFQNDSAEINAKISRALGVLTSTLSLGVGAATQNPIAIAGGAISLVNSATSGVGIATNAHGTGGDGFQALFSGEGALFGHRNETSALAGGLQVFAHDYTNSKNMRDTINMFGVNTNFSFRGDITYFMTNKYQYTKFDNVRVYNAGSVPQFRDQLREMLERGVYIWNTNPDNYELFWDGDFNEFQPITQ